MFYSYKTNTAQRNFDFSFLSNSNFANYIMYGSVTTSVEFIYYLSNSRPHDGSAGGKRFPGKFLRSDHHQNKL